MDDTACVLTQAGVPTDETLARCRVKLCGWGLSKHQALFGWAQTPGLGNATFWAPELVTTPLGQPYDGRTADVWACAVMLFALLRGQYPHGTLLTPERAREIIGNNINAFAPPLDALAGMNIPSSDLCIELLRGMLALDAGARLSVDDALAHRWFDNVREMVRVERWSPHSNASSAGIASCPDGCNARRRLSRRMQLRRIGCRPLLSWQRCSPLQRRWFLSLIAEQRQAAPLMRATQLHRQRRRLRRTRRAPI